MNLEGQSLLALGGNLRAEPAGAISVAAAKSWWKGGAIQKRQWFATSRARPQAAVGSSSRGGGLTDRADARRSGGVEEKRLIKF
jgi:hypothetical protein